jgi:flavin reductase (DIM6/NTAB) family NADH-FMN oxidoreductase RutF
LELDVPAFTAVLGCQRLKHGWGRACKSGFPEHPGRPSRLSVQKSKGFEIGFAAEFSSVALVGRIKDSLSRGTHSVMFVEIESIRIRDEAEALVYYDRGFHRVSRLTAV